MKLNSVLYVMCGLPGSGKTTLAKKIALEKNAILLSEDEFMEDLFATYYGDKNRDSAAALQRKLTKSILEKNINVVMDAGFYSKNERDLLRGIASKVNADFELHFLDTSLNVIKNRIEKRNVGLKPEYQTKFEDVEMAFEKYFQIPTNDENCINHSCDTISQG